MTEVLCFVLLNPNGYCRGRPRIVLVNRLEVLACSGTVPLLTDRLDMTSLLTGP